MSRFDYTDLLVWQDAMALVERCYRASGRFPASERFGLTSQMRRAAVSIPANIAEGQGRRTRGEFLNQLSVAHGSLREVETYIQLAERLGMLESAVAQGILEHSARVGRLLNGLMRSLERTDRP